MEILPATTNDIDEITNVEIRSKMASFPSLVEPHDIDFETRQYRWKTWFAAQSPATSKPQRVLFKAVADNSIIGYIAVHLTTRYEKDAEIQSFYVLKEYQRKGIGTGLLLNAVNWLETQHTKSLCVGIAKNTPYRAFYIKYGGGHLNEHWICWEDVAAIIMS
ncbi:GNAT family N-acetyltransferase [Mucilaginibacter rubeus]|uniref:GNAT family N-acetyltransferase n=1 Tax=Mucilaginibacter rubeus TaxID=2027860 RepID=A0AAE6JJ84_9SPHI|nr:MULTISPECIES: GNAT family N-acetyltransferase [Mucilaginibacter]QEM05627.1 GNAT family N-acetyltransferase [Mucilaginibacter rubeus]QEM18214.1 GNAT family N-acetyltransferase [Mucilaginibacter gossypii]QTE45253.1 GNAT family N-acetyltransferase [Mucilaginibacter rubeus]QTE51849.1 GNAT family N-acetyltransferase [Mucilaginibacter rubeus]QTE56937.1 GNAT family N-acetyltransferase [Mucilaginibacter rubeus]